MLVDKIREDLVKNEKEFSLFEAIKVLIQNEKNEDVYLDLEPLDIFSKKADATMLFSNIKDAKDLVNAYKEARESLPFEEDNENLMLHVSKYSKIYLESILKMAENLEQEDVILIADFVKNLDTYTAVRACETLFVNNDNLELLKLAKSKKNWTVLFDHLAIRTGSKKTNSAKNVAEMLVKHHGYNYSNNLEQKFYEFEDGWSAYVLYKLLNNGQVLRLFVDQSDVETQIIKHWNYVYGYTAHHLGLRIVELQEGVLRSISLKQIELEMYKRGVKILKATGLYTKGLLEQVFTKPQKDENIPQNVLSKVNSNLIDSIKNAKLLEIVARKELPVALAKELYTYYNLTYEKDNALFSAPYYNYFLPAQAAHVIKTSM